MHKHLPGVGYDVPDATHLRWIDFRDTPLVAAPPAATRDRPRVVDEGALYGDVGSGHPRLNFATLQTLLRELLTSMGRALREG